MTVPLEDMRKVAERWIDDRDSITVCLASYVLILLGRVEGHEDSAPMTGQPSERWEEPSAQDAAAGPPSDVVVRPCPGRGAV